MTEKRLALLPTLSKAAHLRLQALTELCTTEKVTQATFQKAYHARRLVRASEELAEQLNIPQTSVVAMLNKELRKNKAHFTRPEHKILN